MEIVPVESFAKTDNSTILQPSYKAARATAPHQPKYWVLISRDQAMSSDASSPDYHEYESIFFLLQNCLPAVFVIRILSHKEKFFYQTAVTKQTMISPDKGHSPFVTCMQYHDTAYK